MMALPLLSLQLILHFMVPLVQIVLLQVSLPSILGSSSVVLLL
ncbi:hypothetical protein A2U01_0071550, partial [Trifolium medium]|nr:hypothetical protein [Trifolium medium]